MRYLLFSTCVFCVPVLPLIANDWQQWRGPNRTGIVAEADWPSSLSEESLAQQWAVDLGPSYSTPIVTSKHVFVTETRDKSMEVVQAFDRKNGEKIWEKSWQGAMKVPFFANSNGSWIRATPVADEQNLYVAGMRDVLVCLDQETGEIQWSLDFAKKLSTPLPSFGFVSSPMIDGESLYVQAGGGIAKVNKSDGEILWRALTDGGGMGGSAFSSPVILTLHGVRQLVVQTRTYLAGLDLESGDVLWKQEIEAFRGMNIVTPTQFKQSLFTSTYGGGTFLVSPEVTNGKWSVSIAWRNKVQGYMSSPVILDGHAYLHLRNERFACIDLNTGKEAWITKPFGKYWSLVSNGKEMLALDSSGDLFLIDPSPDEFRILDQRHMSDSPSWAHLVVAGDEVFIRTLNQLLSFEWKKS